MITFRPHLKITQNVIILVKLKADLNDSRLKYQADLYEVLYFRVHYRESLADELVSQRENELDSLKRCVFYTWTKYLQS